ncbi:MAG: FAD-dependent oxidoreductase [Lachnospiraceae bacterium]|nr:FAD-dependent oxidoreductase [Lachnospiraceae bacterium]
MLKINQIKCKVGHNESELLHALAKKLRINIHEIISYEIIRRSVDARHKPDLYFMYTLFVSLKNEKTVLQRFKNNTDISKEEKTSFSYSVTGDVPLKQPVIIGAGPTGLFCALELVKHGFKPLVLERGKDVDARLQDVEAFWESGKLLPNSNVQFGEGGAGTFSDGKLNTLVKDTSGRNRHVLQTFVEYGADPSILYDHKPHIGTDKLRDIIKRMRQDIISHGGSVLFESQMTDVHLKNNKITEICINDSKWIETELVILAIGHSARDTFELLYANNVIMEPKSFAVGFRVIHPQSFINESQYGALEVKELGAAPYKVTAKALDGRGVYSFCMCPGGYVVNASSENGYTAVNGMSYSGRNSRCANSAIIISVSPEDFPSKDALSGMHFQRILEKNAFTIAQGKVPVQKYGDYVNHLFINKQIDSVSYSDDIEAFEPEIKGEFSLSDLTEILPHALNKAFVEGMTQINHKIKGFASKEVWLCGLESRTSSPVKILRNEQLASNIKNLYPCGEGAGYAGGITSAAMDGVKIAMEIASIYKPVS